MNIIQTWTTERIDRLKELWAKGFSYGHIANEFGLTRNAVGGKLDRLGLSGRERQRPLTRAERTERRKIARAFARDKCRMALPLLRSKSQPEPKPIETPPLNIGLIKLKHHHCRYVTGKGKDGLATFCGHEIFKYSTCVQHHRITRQPGTRQA